MKIVFLSDDFPPHSSGGAGFSTFELAAGVARRGHEVFVVTTCRSAEDEGRFSYEGITVVRLASNYHARWRAWRSLYNPPIIQELKKLLQEFKPDVVHANNVHFYLSYYSITLARKLGARVIWTGRDAMSFSYGKLNTPRYLKNFDARLTWLDHIRQAKFRYNPLRGLGIRYYLSRAHERFAVSEALREAMRQNGIHNVSVIHTGERVEAWSAPEEDVAAFKSRLALEGKRVILFGGRLNAAAQTLKAMSLVAPKDPDARLVMMGKEEAFVRLKASAPHIVFAGWLSGAQKVAAYCAADVVWVPSDYFDAFPRSALEAAAAGAAVVATSFGGARELVEDGATGYVINTLKPEEIADATLKLLADPDKARRFGEAGRERVKKEFSMDTYIDRYIAAYER